MRIECWACLRQRRPLVCPNGLGSLLPRKIVLRLPDLDHAKSSVLNSLSSPRSRRNYKFAMEQFITWYCSEPRLALNRIVVLRFRLHLESLGLAAGTINQRLAAVRRLAYEAADAGLLSPELAAGIRRVKGVKQLGSRSGNWLNREQARLLLEKSDGEGLRSVRDVAMLSILLGCGLRRAELASLRKEDIQVRQGHWAIVDLVGKGNHVRTVPMPIWVKGTVDRWMTSAAVTTGRVFRAVSRHGTSWGAGISENVVWYVVRNCAQSLELDHLAPHELRRTLRKALPSQWRRAGTNPIPARPRLGPDDRAISRLQAEPGGTSERPFRLPVF
jgi:site-specific recombinase XerD